MAQMRHALELARESQGQMVAAMGDAGVGKSRLFFEFKAVSEIGCLVLEANSISHCKASAYLLVIELLREYFHIAVEDDEPCRREKIAGKVLMLDRSLRRYLALHLHADRSARGPRSIRADGFPGSPQADAGSN
jgi:hypothetical protein